MSPCNVPGRMLHLHMYYCNVCYYPNERGTVIVFTGQMTID